MSGPHDQSGVGEEFDVVIVGFSAREHTPEAGLKRVFGLDDETAEKLVQSLPATVQRGVNRVRAEYFRKALDLIGAHVEVRNPRGEVEAPPAAAERAPKPAARAAEPAPRPAAEVAPVMALPDPPAQAAAPHAAVPLPVARPPTPLEIAMQPNAFGATLAMRDIDVLPPSAAKPAAPLILPPAAPTTAATPFASPPTAAVAPIVATPAVPTPAAGPPAVHSSANATLKEAVPLSAVLSGLVPQADHSAAATADTQALPRGGFRFGDTNAPFMRGILGDPAPSAEPAAAPVAPMGGGGLSFNLPLPIAAALQLAPAGAAPQGQAPGASAPAASPGGPVVLPPPTAAAPAGAGFGWGEIDRGRHDPQAVASPPGLEGVPADAQPSISLAFQPGKPKAAAAPQEVVLPPPAAGDPAKREPAKQAPARQVLSKGIDPNAKVAAPSAREMAAAIRKQQFSGQASGLGAERADTPNATNILRQAEKESKAARRRMAAPSANVTPAATEKKGVAIAGSAAAVAAQGEATGTDPAQAPGGASLRPEGARSPASSAQASPSSFWQSIGPSLVFPIQGDGLVWIAKISVWSIAVSGIVYVAGMLGVLGALPAFVARTSLLAFCADLHRQALWKTVEGGHELDRGPMLDVSHISRTYVGAGLHLSLFTLLTQLPLVSWVYRTYLPSAGEDDNAYHVMLSPIFWVLAVGPALYWPMALATASVRNDFSAIWNVPLGVRALASAPLQYLTTVLLGILCLLGVWAPFVMVGFVAELPQVFFDATLGLGLAFSCCVMGALTGHLARSRPGVFS